MFGCQNKGQCLERQHEVKVTGTSQNHGHVQDQWRQGHSASTLIAFNPGYNLVTLFSTYLLNGNVWPNKGPQQNSRLNVISFATCLTDIHTSLKYFWRCGTHYCMEKDMTILTVALIRKIFFLHLRE